jgi:hypothetical protein
MTGKERQRVLIHLLGRPIVAEVRSGARPELAEAGVAGGQRLR